MGSGWSVGNDVVIAFGAGFVAALAVVVMVAAAAISNSDVYGLGHWKLNARMPLATMWMNLGYWTNAKGERIEVFEEACATLLKEILRTAGLMKAEESTVAGASLGVLDVGFGCGDQTWELVRLLRPASLGYVGLTMNEAQVQSASRRIHQELSRDAEAKTMSETITPASFRLFRADAARPETWNKGAREALSKLDGDQKWLLALDCLYHFRPSRRPLLSYAAHGLGANVMAFDLVLNEGASTLETLAVRAVGLMMGCPLRTFLTEPEYRAQLADCGFDGSDAVLRDVSEHVFLPVAGFIDGQDRRLSEYGVGMGGFKLAGRLFAWFGRSRVVRAVVVVAKARA